MTKTNFFTKVYKVVRQIPNGKVATYGQIAEILGTKDARKVGWALHANKNPKVPCHRVVDRNGRLAPNYAFNGWKEQKMRLLAEGVKFKNPPCRQADQMYIDLERFLWKAG